MSEQPRFRLNRHPRFSVNHLADYLSTVNATQRTSVIRRAKFPRIREASSYAQIRQPLGKFLTGSPARTSDLDELIERLETRARREPEARDEALRCKDAVIAFRDLVKSSRLARHRFVAAPRDLAMKIEGVSINVHLDAQIVEDRGDEAKAGGVVFFLAASDAARKNIAERRKAVAGTVLWALEGRNMEPLARLCMSMDVCGGIVERASDSHSRFRSNVAHSCREVCGIWNDVEPPEGYDGPDWR